MNSFRVLPFICNHSFSYQLFRELWKKILLRVFRNSSSRMNPVTKSSHRHNDLSGLSLTIGQLCSIQFVYRVFSTLVIVMRAKLWHCIKHAEGKEENAQIIRLACTRRFHVPSLQVATYFIRHVDETCTIQRVDFFTLLRTFSLCLRCGLSAHDNSRGCARNKRAGAISRLQ